MKGGGGDAVVGLSEDRIVGRLRFDGRKGFKEGDGDGGEGAEARLVFSGKVFFLGRGRNPSKQL